MAKQKQSTKNLSGRGYDYEEFRTSILNLLNNYLLLTTQERNDIVKMAKRF
jgi:hypothetical protein